MGVAADGGGSTETDGGTDAQIISMRDGAMPDGDLAADASTDDASIDDAGIVVHGRCLDNSECFEGEYCLREECGGDGTCAPRPSECGVTDPPPVCGCNGHVFDSTCDAARAGISAAADFSLCEGSMPCASNDDCPSLSRATCVFPDELACGSGGGVCSARIACSASTSPICGCDGVTYDDDCARASAGVARRARGACTP